MKRKSNNVLRSGKNLKRVKEKLRQKINILCRHLNPTFRSRAGKLLAENVGQLSEFQKARKILFFSSLPSEIPTDCLIRKSTGKQIFFPRVSKKHLKVHRVNCWPSDLGVGWKNISEPLPHCQQSLPEEMDLIIVPARGYDIRGNRLGQGGGYYDRLLKSVSPKKCLGVAYSFQILPEVPHTHHDRPVRKIVTEKEIITIKEDRL